VSGAAGEPEVRSEALWQTLQPAPSKWGMTTCIYSPIMANMYPTLTVAVTHQTLLSWSERRDIDEVRDAAAAVLDTYSIRDWLMSDLSAHRTHLSLNSLNWLVSEIEAKKSSNEYLDSSGRWWFASILYRNDLLPGINDLDAILSLAEREPNRFGADAELVRSAREWDSGCAETAFDIPNVGDGDDPMYVVCTVFALRRLLDFAYSNGLCVLHLQYSFRPHT